ncbi:MULTISPECIES: hypothetical protein [Streptomycetaceae]|uniref:hypothetical protein n=1 Tax=Streptomycetaceae TaxID=2062 RepID=UPI00093A0DEE|nr:hypothetical protein [Streptomyces sp. CB02056]
MTTVPRWFSEQHGPGGGNGGSLLLRRLDATELDHLTLLVRESAQNSWDARIGDGPVDFRIELRTLGPAEAPAWRALLERDAPTPAHLPLRASLHRSAPRMLMVTDLGTKGLGGPTRADEVSEEASDFVAFVRNVGDSQDAEGRGGTYGAGRVVFHLASAAHTVLVHTRCRIGKRIETRLIGWALHERYTTETVLGPRSFTGRHYWGEVRDRGDQTGVSYVEPLTGEAADTVARELGLHPFPDDATGTTVAIVDPDFGSRTAAEAMRWIADAMVWNLWPKMLPGADGKPPLRLSVVHDGTTVPVSDPAAVPHLGPFVHAFRSMDRTIEHRSLGRVLGTFGLKPLISPFGEPPEPAREAGIVGRVHHACLMRPVDLVVKYLEGPAPTDEAMGYAAVFRADSAMDRVFAASEPATHDDWLVEKLSGDEYRLAGWAMREIKREMKDAAAPRAQGVESGDGVSLARMSRLMSGLMVGAAGQGGAAVFGSPDGIRQPGERSGTAPAGSMAKGPSDTTVNRSGRRGARVRHLDDPFPDIFEGRPVVVQRFQLPDSGPYEVKAVLGVTLGGGGREDSPPEGAAVPEVMGWTSDAGDFATTRTLQAEGGDGKVWSLLVRPAPDTVTQVTLEAGFREVSA